MNFKIYIILILFGCSGTKSIKRGNINSYPQEYTKPDFKVWQQKCLLNIEAQFNSRLSTEEQDSYKNYYNNMKDNILERDESSFIEIIDKSRFLLGNSIKKEDKYYILEYFVEGETSELKFNFITRKNNTCQILNDKIELGNSPVVECDKIKDIFRLRTVWDEEPKALNSYLLMTEFNTDGTFIINIVLALSAWQLIQVSSF